MYRDISRDTEIYQIILQEGREEDLQKGLEEGREKGLEQGLDAFRQVILAAVQKRFPELHELAVERVKAVTDLSVLQKLTLDMIAASSIEQMQMLLDELARNNQGH